MHIRDWLEIKKWKEIANRKLSRSKNRWNENVGNDLKLVESKELITCNTRSESVAERSLLRRPKLSLRIYIA